MQNTRIKDKDFQTSMDDVEISFQVIKSVYNLYTEKDIFFNITMAED